jgi:hypothetical protein
MRDFSEVYRPRHGALSSSWIACNTVAISPSRRLIKIKTRHAKREQQGDD